MTVGDEGSAAQLVARSRDRPGGVRAGRLDRRLAPAGGGSYLVAQRAHPAAREVLEAMPNYQVGEHKIDHPPLFACREHKQFLRFNARFIEQLCSWAGDTVPGNLSEIAAPMVGGRADAFKLPDYLIPPRVLVWNPENLRGPLGLPFTLVFIDKRFIGIPAAYLTFERFEGCDECAASPPPPEPPRAVYPEVKPVAPVAPPAGAPGSMTGSGIRRPPAPAAAPPRPVPAAAAPGVGSRPGTGRFPAPGGGPSPGSSSPGLKPANATPAKGTPAQPVRAPGAAPSKPGIPAPAAPPKPRPRPPEP